MYSYVDSKGHHHQLLSKIVEHKKDEGTTPISKAFMLVRNGNKVQKNATK